MVGNFCAGGAAINAIARQVGAEVVVVDVGVNGDLDPAPNLLRRKVRPGTANIAERAGHDPPGGAGRARRRCRGGPRAGRVRGAVPDHRRHGHREHHPVGRPDRSLHRPPGRPRSWGGGPGIDDAMFAHKTAVVEAALGRTARDVAPDDPLGALASLGGLEIAALAGYIVGAAAAGVPVIVDGVIAAAALVTAAALCPAVLDYCIAGHRSAEPGFAVPRSSTSVCGRCSRLDLRLGEGTGACLALPLVQAAARVLNEMSTFDQAGVTSKDTGDT